MMTIQRTINIPSDKRLVLDLPETVPSGRTSVQLIITPVKAEKPPPAQNHDNPPLDLRDARIRIAAVAMSKDRSGDSSRRFAGCLKGKDIFKGDPVAIQRKMRNEW